MTRKLAYILTLSGVAATLAASAVSQEAAYNVAVGFGSSALVMLASAQSYARAVKSAVEAGAVTYDIDRDVIDKQDDPYDLYSEHPSVETEDVNIAVKEEKARLKAQKRSIGEMVRDSKPAFSLYRLLAYGVLALGFMYLHRHGRLSLGYYLMALGLPIVVSVAYFLAVAKRDVAAKEKQ